jgi:hypothetical protein
MKANANNFKIFRLIHIVLVIGMTLFAIASLLIVRSRSQALVSEDVDRNLQVVVVLLSLLALYFGFKTFKSRILKMREANDTASSRITAYRSACILWWLLIETPGIISFACFIITGNYAFFALGIFHLMILIMFTPRKENIILLLNLHNGDLL